MAVAMTAAERWAALKALADAFKSAADQAVQAVHEDIELTGAKTMTTRFGQVTLSKTGFKVECADPEALAATLPAEACRLVPKDWAVKQALAGLAVVDGQPVDRATGEIAGWADVKPVGGVLSWPASAEQRAAKDLARQTVASRLPALLDGIRQAELEASR